MLNHLRHFEHIIIIPVSGIRQIQKNINSVRKLNFFISMETVSGALFQGIQEDVHAFFPDQTSKFLEVFHVREQ